jgi:hypothetical protein
MRNYIHRIKISFVAAIVLSLQYCSSAKITGAEKICTTEFRIIRIQFKDASGKDVAVNDYHAINKRTGKSVKQTDEGLPGFYAVASDADLPALSTSGDTIQVTARQSQTNETIQVPFVIRGGEEACHIEKISGPEVITIN